MANIASNRWFQRSAALTIAGIVGAVIGVLVAGSGTVSTVKDVAGTVATGEFPEDTAFVGRAMFTDGPSIVQIIDLYGGRPRASRDATDQPLPSTAAEAVAAGWKDPIICAPGRGRYFQNGPPGEDYSHFLMYDTADQLLGIYLFSEAEMPAPWALWESLTDSGLTIIPYEHWGLFVYFQDPSKACQTGEGQAGAGAARTIGGSAAAAFGKAELGGKSTPTPFVPPTPTPTADQKLSRIVTRTAKVSALGFTLKGDPAFKKIEGRLGSKGTVTLVKEGIVTVTDSAGTAEVAIGSLPVSFEGLGPTLSGIAAAIQGPVEAKSTWVDSLSREGISGTVLGSDLSALIPTAVADAPVAVSIWFDDRGRIVRLRIEGAVTPDDPPDAVRVLDVGGF